MNVRFWISLLELKDVPQARLEAVVRELVRFDDIEEYDMGVGNRDPVGGREVSCWGVGILDVEVEVDCWSMEVR